MFYIYFILKIFFFFFLPIYVFHINKKTNFFSLRNLVLSAWIVYVAFLTYIPFFHFYSKNEINIQHLIPVYVVLLIVILYFLLPIIYFKYLNFLLSRLRNITKILGILFLVISSTIIFGIEWYNHSKKVDLDKICYQNHNASKEMLTCCLKAEYVWNEGFAFYDKVPKRCNRFMNLNQ